ncbi:hypothetical protein LUZ60_001755 [Juncus effusus]|nr:hypothetical protein LUZ60_001755 [Juncus effusus]
MKSQHLDSFKFLAWIYMLCMSSLSPSLSIDFFPSMGMSRKIKRLVLGLILGQLLSLLLAIASFTASFIANLGADTPLTQSFFTYLCLALVHGTILLYRRRALMVPWYWYMLLAFVDVQGSFLVVKAFQYTSITSVTLLDCWCVPLVIILTWLVLGTQYRPSHILGSTICILGLVLIFFSDSQSSDQGAGSKPLLGDAFVIGGTFCYAVSNVAEEFCVKKKDLVEVVAMLGVCGVFVSAIQISIFERKNLQEVNWSPTMIFLFAGFAVSAFLFYTIMPYVLKMSGSTLYNLSLLTSDMWAVLIRIFFYHQQVSWLYYIAATIVAIGLVIYSLGEGSDPIITNSDEEATNIYEILREENTPTR